MLKTTTIVTVLPSPFPSSRKKYIPAWRPDVLVPIREITLCPTHHAKSWDESALAYLR